MAVPMLLLATPVAAQRPDRGAAAARPRQELEAEVRRVFADAVRRRVGLSDEQMQKLGPMTERHAVARRRLMMDERAARAELRNEMGKESPSDSAVNRLLARLTDALTRRAQLMETEQRELATIMTPVQRARFNAMQEGLRRQLEQRRGGRGGPGMGAGAGADRPPPRRGRPPG
jgi:Spy/CpxP family protein refolding chaperone